ncbi:hypothetical protein GOBAR_AA27273 [Gossypium barbadense]|uniref:Uncharacterized protein n=1 Tax=Gossypium barbadense TaxID=3634 RepID=A0A2P5WQN4_GOSBA|nr:hypothetical protein GOBAR_AA27273 [Gossypium barbadense]
MLIPFNQGNESTTNRGLNEISGTRWELALVTAPSNHTAPPGRGFDKLLLDSLYEDDAARRQLQLKNVGYGYGYGSVLRHSLVDSKVVEPLGVWPLAATESEEPKGPSFLGGAAGRGGSVLEPIQKRAERALLA